jgi:hypothetical protein
MLAVRPCEEREGHHRLALDAVIADAAAVGVQADGGDELVGRDDARIACDRAQGHVLAGERLYEGSPGSLVGRIDFHAVGRRGERRHVRPRAACDAEDDTDHHETPTCGDRSHGKRR